MTSFRTYLSRARTGLVLAAALVASSASAALHEPTSANVTFKAKTNVYMSVDGRTDQLNASDDGKVVTLSVPLASLKTGIGLRDKHLRETLDTEHFPNAELKVKRSALTFPADGSSKSASATGQLVIHGQSQPTEFSYRAERKGSDYKVSGSFSVNMTAHGIQPPSYAGVTVKPDVEVKASFRIKD